MPKRRRTTPPAEGGQDEDGQDGQPAAPGKKQNWKPVEISQDFLSAFERDGGCMLEELDGEDVQYMVGDRRGEMVEEELPLKRKKRTKRRSPKRKEEAVEAQQKELLSQEELEAKLPDWAPFGLHVRLLGGLQRLGFQKPTAVQAHCLRPALLQRKDIVGAAQTGSGKTLAFGLPILHHTLNEGDTAGSRLRALIMLPTRELAVQVKDHLAAVAQEVAVNVVCLVGGMAIQKQYRLLKRGPQVVVGTPGRTAALLGIISMEEPSEPFIEALPGLRHLVLDEADRLVEGGHFKELADILEKVYSSIERPGQLQSFVFSATLTLDPKRNRNDLETKLEKLMHKMKFRDARSVHTADLTRAADLERAEGNDGITPTPGCSLPAKLSFGEIVCSSDKDRESFLTLWLLHRYRWQYERDSFMGDAAKGGSDFGPGRGGRTLVFLNAVNAAMKLESIASLILESPSAGKVLARVQMKQSKDGGKPKRVVEVLGLHSKMRQKDRLSRVEKFRKSEHAVLVCTDVAARGLDLPGVETVIHYHVPRNAEIFVHRSGRTARAGAAGESIAMVSSSDIAHWTRLYGSIKLQKASITAMSPTAFEVVAAKEATQLANKLENKIHKDKKRQIEKSWRRRTAEAADLMLSESEEDVETRASPKVAMRALKSDYWELLDRVRKLPKRVGGAPQRKWANKFR